VYFGAKKANEPVHILYSYADGSVRVANLSGARQSDLRAKAEFIDLNGTVEATSEVPVTALASQDVKTVLTPAVPAGISTTYFVRLTLTQGHRTVSRNVYWLSTKPDSIDWANTIDQGYGAAFTPGGYADLTGLQSLAPASVKVTAKTHRSGDNDVTEITVSNVGHDRTPAFLTRADIHRASRTSGNATGDQVLPVLWSDNDITLWPGESQTVTATYRHADLYGAAPVVTVSGWNTASQAVHPH
jgi:hypothetical protein